MKTLVTGAIASIAFAGSAFAADGIKIESEAQFVRDYADQIEQVGPGVYQVVSGKLAGKTISIGEAGLQYDISEQRALVGRAAKTTRARAANKEMLRKLEGVQARYAELRALTANDAATRVAASGSFPCYYWGGSGFPVWYSGYAFLDATTELYRDRGNGTLNWYYARASASAYGGVNAPYNVPAGFSLVADASAQNLQTGETISDYSMGVWSINVATGYVYSGPVFSHNIRASASVSGIGNCWGYVSVSDKIEPIYY
jgi:hypothetical protein